MASPPWYSATIQEIHRLSVRCAQSAGYDSSDIVTDKRKEIKRMQVSGYAANLSSTPTRSTRPSLPPIPPPRPLRPPSFLPGQVKEMKQGRLPAGVPLGGPGCWRAGGLRPVERRCNEAGRATWSFASRLSKTSIGRFVVGGCASGTPLSASGLCGSGKLPALRNYGRGPHNSSSG
jgi:hypothetical protein